jgi:ABC-type phosphate transport system auxiliary subunit
MKQLLPFLIILSFIITTSCSQKEASQNPKENVTLVGNDTIQLPTPKNLKATIRLTPQAQEGVKNWSFYNDLSAAVDSLPSNTLGELRLKIIDVEALYINLEQAEEDLAPVTPEAVKTKAVNARLVAIETKAKVLQNSAQLNTPVAEDISKKIGELYNAYQDLNLQLNELFDTSFKDLLEEIKQENEQAASEKADEQTPN